MRKTGNDIRRLQGDGFYRDIDLERPELIRSMKLEKKIAEKMGFRAVTDDRYKLLRCKLTSIYQAMKM